MLKEARVIKWCNTNGRENFSSAYLHKYERSRGLDMSRCTFLRARLSGLVLTIAVSNINGYRFSHSFIYVQLIASLLLSRWSLHFSNFLLRVNVNYGQVNMFVPTV